VHRRQRPLVDAIPAVAVLHVVVVVARRVVEAEEAVVPRTVAEARLTVKNKCL
jgi:hypothetical protein